MCNTYLHCLEVLESDSNTLQYKGYILLHNNLSLLQICVTNTFIIKKSWSLTVKPCSTRGTFCYISQSRGGTKCTGRAGNWCSSSYRTVGAWKTKHLFPLFHKVFSQLKYLYHWLIDRLVFNTNLHSISAILWREQMLY